MEGLCNLPLDLIKGVVRYDNKRGSFTTATNVDYASVLYLGACYLN
jgi:hypothetical protein